MDENELLAALEGILFAAGEPVSLERLTLVTGESEERVLACLNQIADEYSYSRRGIRLVRMDQNWQMVSAPEQAGIIRRCLERRKPPQLSPSALEALSVIAYFQPTTRAYVDQVRGVDSSYTMNLLQERGLIEECGRLQVPGRPVLFKTTDLFLRSFGLNTLDDLPPLPESGANSSQTDRADDIPADAPEAGK